MPPESSTEPLPIGAPDRGSGPARADGDDVGAALAVGAGLVIGAGIAAAFWMMNPPYRHRWMLADLEVYRAAGRALAHGHSVYGPYVARQLTLDLPFIYPPIAAGFALPFTAMPAAVAAVVWTGATVALLAVIVRLCCARVVESGPRALAVGTAAALALAPVQEHLRFGQVGIVLLACVVVDCLGEHRRIPAGILTGLATAVKLVPGIFVPYLWFTGRRRAAGLAIVTFAVCFLAGAVVAPSDSQRFWTDEVFSPVSTTFFSNQSLQGMLARAIGPWLPVWVLAVVAVGGFGLHAGVAASRSGDERRGVAIVAIVGALVSPISWIHHLVAVIPALGVLADRARTPRQVAAVTAIALILVARVPYVGQNWLGGHGVLAGAVVDAYGLLLLGLLLHLGRLQPAAGAAQASPPRSTSKAW